MLGPSRFGTTASPSAGREVGVHQILRIIFREFRTGRARQPSSKASGTYAVDDTEANLFCLLTVDLRDFALYAEHGPRNTHVYIIAATEPIHQRVLLREDRQYDVLELLVVAYNQLSARRRDELVADLGRYVLEVRRVRAQAASLYGLVEPRVDPSVYYELVILVVWMLLCFRSKFRQIEPRHAPSAELLLRLAVGEYGAHQLRGCLRLFYDFELGLAGQVVAGVRVLLDLSAEEFQC